MQTLSTVKSCTDSEGKKNTIKFKINFQRMKFHSWTSSLSVIHLGSWKTADTCSHVHNEKPPEVTPEDNHSPILHWYTMLHNVLSLFLATPPTHKMLPGYWQEIRNWVLHHWVYFYWPQLWNVWRKWIRAKENHLDVFQGSKGKRKTQVISFIPLYLYTSISFISFKLNTPLSIKCSHLQV